MSKINTELPRGVKPKRTPEQQKYYRMGYIAGWNARSLRIKKMLEEQNLPNITNKEYKKNCEKIL